MRGRFFPFLEGNGRFFSFGMIAVIFTVLGIILASNLDFTNKSIATDPQSSYPIVQSSSGEYTSPFISVVEKVSDAVVNIVAEVETPRSYNEDFFYRFFEIPHGPSVSSGSGFFFRSDGYILTNNHVVQNARKVAIRTSSGYQYSADIVGADPQTDLAVLRVTPKEEINFIPFGNSDEIKVGDWAIAIGNPFPQQGLDRTVTVGVVSAKGRSNLRFGGDDTPRYQDYIQTDASINPGNSGGPLLNLRGEAIGINAAISSPSGGSVGIGFAIPINLARAVVPDLIATGKVTRGWLGVGTADVTEEQAKQMSLGAVKGVYVDSVFKDSPADLAGIKKGDILIEFNGQQVSDASQFPVLVATAPRDKTIPATLVRNGKRINVEANIVDIEQYRKTHAAQFAAGSQRVTWLGMELMTFTATIASEKGFDYFPGVYVNRITRSGQADRAGILPGSIITSVDNIEVKDLDDLRRIAGNLQGRRTAIPLLVVDPTGLIEYKAVRP